MRRFFLSEFSRYRTQLMGIAILGVSLLHALKWAGIDESLVAKLLEPLARIAFTEGFLFLSGFGLVYSFSKDSDCRRFYAKRVKRLWLPYMMMALPFYLYGLYSGSVEPLRVLAKLATAYFWIWGNDGMWYISMSVALYLLFPVAYRFMFKEDDMKHVWLRTLLVIFACYAVQGLVYICSPGYYGLLQIGISKAPIFFVGMLAAYLAQYGNSLTVKHLIGGGVLLLATYLLKRWSPFWTPSYEMAFRLLAMPAACIMMKWLQSEWLERVLGWFGRYTLEIYVLQMLMIGVAGSVLLAYGVSDSYLPILKTCLCFAVVIAVANPVHKVTTRL